MRVCSGSVCGVGVGGGRKRTQIVKLHPAYFSGSQTRTDLLTPFKGLTRARFLLTADLLANSRIRLLLRAGEGGRAFPKALSPFPAGRKE